MAVVSPGSRGWQALVRVWNGVEQVGGTALWSTMAA
jgi:hypothetical protein